MSKKKPTGTEWLAEPEGSLWTPLEAAANLPPALLEKYGWRALIMVTLARQRELRKRAS